MGNTFGQLFRVTTWGESHGAATGAVIDGCPPRLALSEADIQPDLDRRRPGQSLLTSQRKESDTVRILSGVFDGPDARDADRARDPERGHAARGLPRDAGEVPAEPRRLHLRREVRDPGLAGRGTDERAGDRGARRGGRRRAEAPPRPLGRGGRRLGGQGRPDRRRVRRRARDARGRRADADPLSGSRRRRADDRGRRGRAEGRELARRPGGLRRAADARPAGASPSSTGSRPTSPRRC